MKQYQRLSEKRLFLEKQFFDDEGLLFHSDLNLNGDEVSGEYPLNKRYSVLSKSLDIRLMACLYDLLIILGVIGRMEEGYKIKRRIR